MVFSDTTRKRTLARRLALSVLTLLSFGTGVGPPGLPAESGRPRGLLCVGWSLRERLTSLLVDVSHFTGTLRESHKSSAGRGEVLGVVVVGGWAERRLPTLTCYVR